MRFVRLVGPGSFAHHPLLKTPPLGLRDHLPAAPGRLVPPLALRSDLSTTREKPRRGNAANFPAFDNTSRTLTPPTALRSPAAVSRIGEQHRLPDSRGVAFTHAKGKATNDHHF
jgi:hypothetical protein